MGALWMLVAGNLPTDIVYPAINKLGCSPACKTI